MKHNIPLANLTDADKLKQTELERSFVTHWRMFSDGMPDPVLEYEFHDVRKFRLDFAWPEHRVAVECQGIADHATAKGLNRDCAKMNLAQAGEWVVFQATTRMLERDPAGFVVMVVDCLRDRIEHKAALEEARETMCQYARGVGNAAADAVACMAKRGT